jgi:hypothetical protein
VVGRDVEGFFLRQTRKQRLCEVPGVVEVLQNALSCELRLVGPGKRVYWRSWSAIICPPFVGSRYTEVFSSEVPLPVFWAGYFTDFGRYSIVV